MYIKNAEPLLAYDAWCLGCRSSTRWLSECRRGKRADAGKGDVAGPEGARESGQVADPARRLGGVRSALRLPCGPSCLHSPQLVMLIRFQPIDDEDALVDALRSALATPIDPYIREPIFPVAKR